MPMETMTSIVLPDFLPYLLAIFGLLVLWQSYQLRVMKGRILAIDIFDRSGIRMYLYAVADDLQACEVCRLAHGTVFPPSEVMKRQFSPIKGICKSPARCTGFLVGLYGAWPEANQIVVRLRLSRKREPIQLDQDELRDNRNRTTIWFASGHAPYKPTRKPVQRAGLLHIPLIGENWRFITSLGGKIVQ